MTGRLRPPAVLAYHAVGDIGGGSDPQELVLDAGRFERQVRLLHRAGYRFLTAGELVARGPDRPLPPATAALTFDDGWMGDATVVSPILRRLGVRATFFVCPDWLAGGSHPEVEGVAGQLLDEAGVAALVADGHEVGSHSLAHRDLRKLADAELADDLARSKAALEELTGRPCPAFAYPYGLFGEREERAVAAAGYEVAFAWGEGPWRRFAVPRLPTPPRNGAAVLALKMLGVRRPR